MIVPNGASCMHISNAARFLYLPKRKRTLLSLLNASDRAAIGACSS
jgi:hypothetical protein